MIQISKLELWLYTQFLAALVDAYLKVFVSLYLLSAQYLKQTKTV